MVCANDKFKQKTGDEDSDDEDEDDGIRGLLTHSLAHIAVCSGNVDVLRAVLDAGAGDLLETRCSHQPSSFWYCSCPRIFGAASRAPVHVAAANGDAACLRVLAELAGPRAALFLGALTGETNDDDGEWHHAQLSAAHYAAYGGHDECLRVLHSHGVRLDQRATARLDCIGPLRSVSRSVGRPFNRADHVRRNVTPAHLAAAAGRVSTLALLCELSGKESLLQVTSEARA